MDEKSSGRAGPSRPPTRAETARRHVSKWRFPLGGLFVSVIVFSYLTHSRYWINEPFSVVKDPSAPQDDPMNPWKSITPSPDLHWHPCYSLINPSFLCARLTVPMDYSRPLTSSSSPFASDSESDSVPKVHVALLLLPAQKPNYTETHHEASPSGSDSDPSSRSNTGTRGKTKKQKQPLLLNPGGPGGSGVTLALLTAASMQKILGPDQPILGFDPRGVGFTTPLADCWATPDPSCHGPGTTQGQTQTQTQTQTDGGSSKGGCKDDATTGYLHRLEWDRLNTAFGLISEGKAAMRFLEAGHRAVNDLCRGRDGRVPDGVSGLAWAGTRQVARDMVRVVDAWEEWVDRRPEGVVVGEREGGMRGKVVYWGFSYGTYLGAVFARMFPERVGRVVLDGVVDAELYEEPVWSESLVDADRVLEEFFRFCVKAGRRCDLYRDGDSVGDVKRRYEALMEGLETNPVTFTHPVYFYPVMLRGSVIKMIVLSVLYAPIQGFPLLATLLNWIHEDKHELLSGMFLDSSLVCSIAGNPTLMGMLSDAQRAIMCSDKRQPVNMTLPEWTAAYDTMAETSQFADIWVGVMMKCSGWDIGPPHQAPSDPWAMATQLETANPILFLSNTYDPVTPLRAAVKMALKFKGAGLLEQNGLGHCTMSAASRCTARAVKEYVAGGKAPPPPKGVDGEFKGDWARCEVDETPWESAGPSMFATLAAEEREMMEGWQHVQKVMQGMPRWDVGSGLSMEAVMALAREE